MIVSTTNAIEKSMTRASFDEVYDALPAYERSTASGGRSTDPAISDKKSPSNEKLVAPPAYTESSASGPKKSFFGMFKSKSKAPRSVASAPFRISPTAEVVPDKRHPAFAAMEASGMTPILMPDMPSGLASAWKPRPATQNPKSTKAERVRAGPRQDRPEIDLAISIVAGQAISQVTVAPPPKKTKAEKVRTAPRYERFGADLALAIAQGSEGLDAKR